MPMTGHAASSRCDPVTYSARHDGRTNDGPAIQRAITVCSEAGGGVVSLASGIWLSGPLSLKNHVTLNLEKGSTLLGSSDTHLFHWAFLGNPAQPGEALISAIDVQDVAITGQGHIDGNGAAVWWPQAVQAHKTQTSGPLPYGPDYPGVPAANGLPRPWLIEFSHVQHGRISGVMATNSPMWTVVVRDSGQIRIDHLTIRNPASSRNTDGIDLVSSDHVTMSNLEIATGDDNIAIKSGLTQPGQAASDISITQSRFGEGHGLSIGSELANGAHHIRISDVSFQNTLSGLRIKSGRDRGGDIGWISAEHLTMDHVRVPLSISDYYAGQPGGTQQTALMTEPAAPVTSTTPHIHDVTITDMTATNAGTVGVVLGLPEAPIEGLTLRHVRLSARKGLQLSHVRGRASGSTFTVQTPPVLQYGPGVHIDGSDLPCTDERRVHE
ncbi:glycoside hydrolase family 28 protein [Gluconobacter kondonii]|uniref:glycoside hydrolase family 28 protein n=1 Tax=Gluconobacter kondonii TaxID=941463 RepID=UPI0019802423|nr:glycosyl hydrolase family 28 protein [Gluconobacter kondonii]MBN3868635.1 glycoside hydrolase [Gluconobacter kondonii]